MKETARLSDKEYEALSLEYEQNPPELSGTPGFFTSMREQLLITELLPPDYAHIVKTKARAMALSPSEVIQHAIKAQLLENTSG
ncbi:MAG: hypothetical protein FWH48_03575 [Oscillospiraceae bacterium]|nr:hypothetical protein [Oscillospiraceae bacterium]